MATGAQLRTYEVNRREHGEKVAAVEQHVRQALPVAAVQLAAALEAGDELQDVTLREGFDPAEPSNVLTPSELHRLPSATLVVDAIANYINGTLRLQNQTGPRVHGGVVTQGRI